MQPFTKITGVVAPMDRVDVDTDQIIPAQFLKRIEKTGFGQFLFYKWRFDEDGLAQSRLRAEPAGIRGCLGPRFRQELRVGVVPRARSVGAP